MGNGNPDISVKPQQGPTVDSDEKVSWVVMRASGPLSTEQHQSGARRRHRGG
jgi:hypothetical protein